MKTIQGDRRPFNFLPILAAASTGQVLSRYLRENIDGMRLVTIIVVMVLQCCQFCGQVANKQTNMQANAS